jgi:hypothetical protein
MPIDQIAGQPLKRAWLWTARSQSIPSHWPFAFALPFRIEKHQIPAMYVFFVNCIVDNSHPGRVASVGESATSLWLRPGRTVCQE